MRLSKRQLKRIIREEYRRLITELNPEQVSNPDWYDGEPPKEYTRMDDYMRGYQDYKDGLADPAEEDYSNQQYMAGFEAAMQEDPDY